MSFAELVGNVIVPIVDGAIIPLLYALSFIFFLYGVVKYFFLAGEEAKNEGKTYAIFGLVGLVVLFSVWGFVRLILHSFLDYALPFGL
ncbi:MAG: hypothetical protein ABA06_00875 [Parcubacteria bacterium C7867-001]|nr:MAG: hypothetical protein ABA06_00875 [Parcubacteria bacterium C7867-001]